MRPSRYPPVTMLSSETAAMISVGAPRARRIMSSRLNPIRPICCVRGRSMKGIVSCAFSRGKPCSTLDGKCFKLSVMLNKMRKMTPSWALDLYHRFLAWLAAILYRHPSRDLIVIGVTGTSGKSSTCYFLAKALEADGSKTGMTSTAFFKVADSEWTNDTKMTMLGRFKLQKMLRNMVDAGCRYAIVETTSQGIVQHRHQEIDYDICVFTNLYPEHLEAHGGFENYKQAKLELFRHTASLPPKSIEKEAAPRIAVLNKDNEHAKDFALKKFDRIVWFGVESDAEYQAKNVASDLEQVAFYIGDTHFEIHTPGEVMVYNAIAAIATAEALGFPREELSARLRAIRGIPGRYEFIHEGQSFHVIVDYAFEPVALERLFDTVSAFKNGRIIHVTGSAGGGRDLSRRPLMGSISAKRADITIVTNEDPYDDDPMKIIEDVAKGAAQSGRKDGVDLFKILDRSEAITKAIGLAESKDIVLITGKGNEPVMAVADGKKIPWDDREVTRSVLKELLGKSEGDDEKETIDVVE
ncbi:UDP-N-acetylmuramyl-tripeptide synthetase [Candidatus Uhrbacteria bacterium]|nr:UDP-N-acetylmuramyl-tripeptide synthetase [Candidatus Uhrbacteria bacterium]MBD3284090.1 UDP-N-acetylmuramyl-tripeptide synthetase [Candidatus Uhrbacteria bacterium]